MGYLLFDGIVLLVLAVTAVQGYRKGLVLTLCGFLAVFVAFVGASVLSDALARPISQAIAPAVERGIQESIGDYYQYTPPAADGSQTDSFFAELPLEDAISALQDSSLFRGISETFSQAVNQGLDLAFKLPVLSALNQWSGAAVGLVKGCVLLFIACWLLKGMLPQEAVDQSVLLHFFCTTNPFALIASVP